MAGAIASSHGGNSAPSVSFSPACRSIPVIAATRAERSSARASWPRTPARRRTTDTTKATSEASTTPADAMSRTGTEPITVAAAIEPAAKTA